MTCAASFCILHTSRLDELLYPCICVCWLHMQEQFPFCPLTWKGMSAVKAIIHVMNSCHELVLWPQFHQWICRYVCDERWYNLTRSIRLRGLGFAGQDSLRQPTWCTLPPDKFHALSARTSQQQRPENILLIYKAAAKSRQSLLSQGTPIPSNSSTSGAPLVGHNVTVSVSTVVRTPVTAQPTQ